MTNNLLLGFPEINYNFINIYYTRNKQRAKLGTVAGLGVNCFTLAATGMLSNYDNKKPWVKVQCQETVRAVSDGLNHNKTYKESQRFCNVY